MSFNSPFYRNFHDLRTRQPFGNVHSGPAVQRGYGIGSFFSGLMRTLFNVGKTVAKSDVAKEVGRSLAESAATTGVNVLADAISGDKPVKESLQENISSSRKRVAGALKSGFDSTFKRKKNEAAANKKRTPKLKVSKKKTKFNPVKTKDIFD